MPADAAVGLLRRSRFGSGFFAPGAGAALAGTLRALASDAAVGAKRPDAGVLGRAAPVESELDGVLGRVEDGVLGRASDEDGVLGAGALCAVDGVLGRAPGAGMRDLAVEGGWDDLEGVAAAFVVAAAAVLVAAAAAAAGALDGVLGVGVAADARAGVDLLDERGTDRAILGGADCLGPAAGARRVRTAAGTAADAGSGSEWAVRGGASSDVAGSLCGGDGGLASSGGEMGARERSGGSGEKAVVRRMEGGGEKAAAGAAAAGAGGFAGAPSDDVLTGGHSRDARDSSLTESPVKREGMLVGRGEPFAVDVRFVCCSNRPMRLATDWRGRSSGSGLGAQDHAAMSGRHEVGGTARLTCCPTLVAIELGRCGEREVERGEGVRRW